MSGADGFDVTVTFTEGRAVLGVRGQVDPRGAGELGGILDALIDRGHRLVVLDLAELSFINAAGLGAIAAASGRLERTGGSLKIRSPSGEIAPMFDVTGLTKLLRPDQSDVGELVPEESANLAERLASTGAPGLGHQLRRVAAIPADDDVVDGALRLVVALARATVGGADGVSVSLRRRGRLRTVAASNQTISEMDAEQYATGQGPCIDASVTGRWFHAKSLRDETRWPAFTPGARALGINAILSSPLQARDLPVGALNIYSRSVAAFAAKDQELASQFAIETSAILTEVGVDVTDDETSSRLAEALGVRRIIAQAEGVLMARHGVDTEGAYTTLRHMSLVSGKPLRQQAEDVVATTQDSTPGATTPAGGDHGG